MRYLGIDYGEKNVGIAVSDTSSKVAFPREVLLNDKDLVRTVKDIVENEAVGSVVVGDTRALSGGENKITPELERFARKLEEALDVDIIMEPEYYTSTQARRFTGETEKEDAQAAALILQSFLDGLNSG